MSLQARLSLFLRAFAEQLWSLGVTWPGNPISHAGVTLILSRVQAIPRIVEAFLARRAAGTLRLPVTRAAPRPSARRRLPVPGWPHRLPSRHAWLIRMGLSFAPNKPFAPFGGQLESLLRDPELRSLIDAVPQLRRVFRPLCRMLGVTVLKEPPAQPASARPPATHPASTRAPCNAPRPSGLGLQPPIRKFA